MKNACISVTEKKLWKATNIWNIFSKSPHPTGCSRVLIFHITNFNAQHVQPIQEIIFLITFIINHTATVNKLDNLIKTLNSIFLTSTQSLSLSEKKESLIYKSRHGSHDYLVDLHNPFHPCSCFLWADSLRSAYFSENRPRKEKWWFMVFIASYSGKFEDYEHWYWIASTSQAR